MALLWISILLLGTVYIGKAEISNETRVSTSDYFYCPSGRSRDSMTLAENDTLFYYTNSYLKYENKVKCMLDIKADNCVLSMTCPDFDIDSKRPNCKGGDYLKINRKRYCRPNDAPMIENAKRLKVLFKSNKKKVAKGAYCEIRGVAKPAPGSCKCGLANRSTRIVGGEETEVNEYPWQAGIVSKGSDFVWCGASVLTTKWIITAAHCTEGNSPNQIQVLLGEHDYYDSNVGKAVRKDVIEIEIHANYDSFTTDYDFSLLKLSSPIDFEANSHIRPICLPPNNANGYVDYMATVTGWGTTSAGGSTSNVLREVDVKILSNGVCNNSGYSSSGYTITQQMVCAAAASGNGGKDACQGDSGGPLVTKESGDSGTVAGENYELIGVVSWGIGCAGADFPGVYARVTQQLDWIETITSPTEASTCPRT